MSDKKEMYVGSAKSIGNNGIKLQLDLSQLFEYTKGLAKDKIKTWKDKNGVEHKSIDLVIFPLKPENQTQMRTHSCKIDDFVPDPNWKSKQGEKQPIKVEEDPFTNASDDLPF